jgi:hypothetical protein
MNYLSSLIGAKTDPHTQEDVINAVRRQIAQKQHVSSQKLDALVALHAEIVTEGRAAKSDIDQLHVKNKILHYNMLRNNYERRLAAVRDLELRLASLEEAEETKEYMSLKNTISRYTHVPDMKVTERHMQNNNDKQRITTEFAEKIYSPHEKSLDTATPFETMFAQFDSAPLTVATSSTTTVAPRVAATPAPVTAVTSPSVSTDLLPECDM